MVLHVSKASLLLFSFKAWCIPSYRITLQYANTTTPFYTTRLNFAGNMEIWSGLLTADVGRWLTKREIYAFYQAVEHSSPNTNWWVNTVTIVLSVPVIWVCSSKHAIFYQYSNRIGIRYSHVPISKPIQKLQYRVSLDSTVTLLNFPFKR